jgi:2-methylcitrate dehydratase PrpD
VALALVDKYNIEANSIQEITIFCRDAEYFLVHPLKKRSQPENPVDSQFSIPWAVAAVFARGRAGVGEFTDDAIKSQDILDISMKICIEVDEGLNKLKDADPAKIGVTMKDGQTYTEQSFDTSESADNTLPFSIYERKFRDCAAFSIKPLPEKQVDEIISSIRQLDQLDDIRQLIELLR